MSSYLLDTHILIWFHMGDSRLSPDAIRIIEEGRIPLYISIASLWEMAIKIRLNKLKLKVNLQTFIQEEIVKQGFLFLDITPLHILEVDRLPLHHRDPFDRMIIAQAHAENMFIIGSDPAFRLYDIPIFW